MTAWLKERRQAAAEANATLPVPTLRDEHWRFTSLRGIDFAAFRAAPAAPATAACSRWRRAPRARSPRSSATH